jgi:catechol 2,3-dioxygenase-like lactoylglutathione lyase family enzyme
MIRDIVHLNLNVTDIKRSVAFYEILGFEVMHVFGDGGDSDVPELEKEMDFQSNRCRGAVMTLGDHPRCWTKIELIEWLHPKVEAAPARSMHTAGVSRIALRTNNLLEFIKHLETQDIEMETPPQEIDIVGAKRFALFRDPDGVLLELIEF